jgi:hypothetical protein
MLLTAVLHFVLKKKTLYVQYTCWSKCAYLGVFEYSPLSVPPSEQQNCETYNTGHIQLVFHIFHNRVFVKRMWKVYI